VKRRRVLIIVQNLPVPFDRRVWLEATTLARAGYSVSVICPKGLGFDAERERLEDVDIYRYHLPVDPTSRLGFVLELAIALLRTTWLSLLVQFRGRGFDVIHACNPPETYWILGLSWRVFGKRFLFDHHDLSPELYEVKFGKSRGIVPFLIRRFERATFRTASVVIAPNESHKEVAVGRGNMAPEHVHVVRSAPALERFTVYPSDPTWRNGRQHLIAYLGEMGPQDGVDNLVDALAILRDEFGRDDFHAVFIGGGTHQETARRRADKLSLGGRTTFTGIVSDDELCHILSSADVGVDPVPKNEWSDRSTMNKIMEYMFFGLPVVAFDLHEARVSAGDAGVFATPNMPKSLAAELDRLLDDDARRAAMSRIARRRMEEALSWEHSAPKLLEAYDDVFSDS
jgi:glycosyltransferase involved in cell wall biosynthesis